MTSLRWLPIAVVVIAYGLWSLKQQQFPQPIALANAAEASPTAPAFTHKAEADWLNSKPLAWSDLKGKVVLVDFWTFDCWNCYRSFPWMKSVEEKFAARGLTVLGVHTPELPQEYVRDNVVKKVAEFGLKHPVMIDNDYSYWNAFGNRYWPAFYLVDQQGRVRGAFFGETHPGDGNAKRIEAAIEGLLAEGAAGPTGAAPGK